MFTRLALACLTLFSVAGCGSAEHSATAPDTRPCTACTPAVSFAALHGNGKLDYAGLGALPTGDAAALFGPAFVSLPTTFDRAAAFSPNNDELLFTRLTASGPVIMRSAFRDREWRAPELAPFSDVGFNLEPAFSPDGNTLFFVSTRPPSRASDIWMMRRTSQGWSVPTLLSDSVNSDGFEFHPSAARNGDLYFAVNGKSGGQGQADLYLSRWREGRYLPAENLGAAVNSPYNDWDPYVSPRGDYLLFHSNRPGGYGAVDVYVSRREHGGWTAPVNLGPRVNTKDYDASPYVTPDGRYLVFTRTDQATYMDLYWIDTRAFGALATGDE